MLTVATEPGDDMYSRTSHFAIPGPLHLTPLEARALLYRHRACTAGTSGTTSSCGARTQLLRLFEDRGWPAPAGIPFHHSRPPAGAVLDLRDLEALKEFHTGRCEANGCQMRDYVLERLTEL